MSDLTLDKEKKVKKFVHGIDVLIKTGEYKGYTGEVRDFLPGTVEVIVQDNRYMDLSGDRKLGDRIKTDKGDCIILAERQTKEIKGKGEKKVYLVNCEYSYILSLTDVDLKGDKAYIKNKKVLKNIENRVGKVLNVKYPKLRVLVNTSSGQTEIYLNIKDVFYKDILLKNGNFFQVKKVYDDSIYGTEKDEKTRILMDKEIKMEEIKQYLAGFDIKGKEEVVRDEEEERFVTEEEKEPEVEGEEEDTEESEVGSESEEEPESQYEIDTIMESDADKYKSAYSDATRTERMDTDLTSKELEYKSMIEKALTILGYPVDIINVYDLINEIDIIKEIVQKKLLEKEITTWVNFDEKCIILCLVLYELVKQVSFKKSFDQMIEILNANNYFYVGNFVLIARASIFLRSDWTSVYEIDMKQMKEMNRSKNYIGMVKVAVRNCDKFLQKLLNKTIDLDIMRKEPELIAVKMDARDKEARYMVSLEEVLKGDIPKTAKKIYWNPKTEVILVKQWKDQLKSRAESTDNMLTKMLYEFVLKSFDSAPMVIRDLGESNDKILRDMYEKRYIDEIEKCSDNKCKDRVLELFTREIINDKPKSLKEDDYNNMIKYIELKRIFGLFLEKLPIRVGHKELMQSIRRYPLSKEKSSLEKRREEALKDMDIMRRMRELGLESESSKGTGKKRTRFEKILSDIKATKRRMNEYTESE